MSLYKRLIKKTLRENVTPFTGDKRKLTWRKEILREFGEWAPIDSPGPTNSTSTTFGYFSGGSPVINGETGQQITFTYSGLNGIENYPTSITIDQGFGEVHTTDPPPFSQIGVQGYTAKLNPRYKEAQEKYKKEYDEFKAKSDANFQKIKDTLKSFGTSWEEMRASKKWVKKLPDGTVVAIVPTGSNPSLMDWTNNVKVMKMKQCANASGPMTINYNPPGQYQDWVVENAEIQNEVYLEIGEPPKPPMESEYLMPRRTDYRDVNPLLDASQEFAQQVGADYMMNARVQDPYLTKEPSLGLSQEDQEWLNDKQGLVNKLKIMQNYGGPAIDFAQWAINWAKGDYRPIKKFSPQMQNDVLDQISKTLANRPGTSGAVQYHDYGLFTNNSTRLGLGRFTFDIGPNGVRVKDNFDVDLGGAPVGGVLGYIPGLQNDANKITELGNKVGGGKGKIPIDVTIPWSQVSPELQNKLDPTATIIPIVKRRKRNRRGRVIESTWDRVQKHRKTV